MKLWLLDADIIIDLLSMDLFDKLVGKHNIHVSSTVISEVKYFSKCDTKVEIDFRKDYVEAGLIEEHSASIEEIKQIRAKLPSLRRDSIDSGEIESLAVLLREEELKFCSCDAAAIRSLPFFDLSERGYSPERLLKESGLSASNLKIRHTEEYFRENLAIGKEEKILNF